MTIQRSHASQHQLLMANLIAQIAALREALDRLGAEADFQPDHTEISLMELITVRLNETVATAYYIEGKWRGKRK